MRRGALALAALAAAALPLPAAARPAAHLDGGTLLFFADTLALIARDGAALSLDRGLHGTADAAYVDLRNDRAVLAGHARLRSGSATEAADAIALDLDGDRVDLLDAASGVRRTTRALLQSAPAEIDAARFAFPDVDDRFAYIRSKHAAIVPHADVRFSPAAFPTSVGAVPVPSYLYTFATAVGFGASTLSGASFDQPYGLVGTPTSLTSLHARWIQGPGATAALQEQIVSGDDAYATAAIDAPLRGSATSGLSAYRRMGARYTAQLAATSAFGFRTASASVGAAFGAAGARTSYTVVSGGYSSFDTSVRSPDLRLPGGLTFRLTADAGFDAQRGGLYQVLPDRARYATVWRHGLDGFLATPIVHAPLGFSVGATLEGQRTWYGFPHRSDLVSAGANASRPLTRSLTLLLGYQNVWTGQLYPSAQTLFYPPLAAAYLAPDGTPWYGYAAYEGAAVARLVNADLQYVPNPSTSLRISVRHAADFLQFDGIGRPRWELRGDARFRPFPNIGIAVGRSYDFGWGGTRWVPQWTFAITP